MPERESADRSRERGLRHELARLDRENAELRARVALDEQSRSAAAKYEVIVATLAEGVVVQSAEGEIVACNAAAERILGLSADQMVGRDSMDPRWRSIHEDGSAFPGETHPAMISLRTGEAVSEVVMGVHKPDGVLKWISINSRPLFRPGRDQPCAVVASFADITTHKQSEAHAWACEERLRVALAAAGMATWEWDIEAGRVVWSRDAATIFGLESGTFEQIYGAYIALIHREDRGRVESTLAHAVERGLDDPDSNDFLVEYRLVRPDGSIRWAASFGRVLRDADGVPLKVIGTADDISDRKSFEAQLLFFQRMETVGRMAGGLARDFNDLLTAIVGCAEFVEGRIHEPVASDAIDIIREASEKAAGLTRQLLGFARRLVFNLELIDLRELVGSSELLLSRLLGESIHIQTDLGDEEILIRADRAQLEQVLINLAVNALDAMPKGGTLTIRVEIESSPTGPMALLEVRDTGEGIPEDVLPRIFDPFFTTKETGLGLGLSICSSIVKQFGGDIAVESEPGKGTCVAIQLPLSNSAAGG